MTDKGKLQTAWDYIVRNRQSGVTTTQIRRHMEAQGKPINTDVISTLEHNGYLTYSHKDGHRNRYHPFRDPKGKFYD